MTHGNICPNCNKSFIFDEEFVCELCGIVSSLDSNPPYADDIIIDPFAGNGALDHALQNFCVYRGNLGTNIATTKRNADGSGSESYALKGDNGKFKPVTHVIQPWDLLAAVEPNPHLRRLKEEIAREASKKGIKDEDISTIAAPIISEAKHLRHSAEHFLSDSASLDTWAPKDELIFFNRRSRMRIMKLFMSQVKESFGDFD